jgi:hypothetical protein
LQTSIPEPTDIESPPSGFIAEGIPAPFLHRDGSDEDAEVDYLRYLIAGLAVNNTIIIVPTNTAFARLAINFNCRMRNLGVTNVLYWVLDASAATILREYHFPIYDNPTFYSSKEEETYHTENYIKMMSFRPKFWKMVVRTGFNMMFLDVDNVILRNPLEELVGDVDLEGQVDEFSFSRAIDKYNIPYLCGGVFFLKSNARTLKFLDRMEKALLSKTNDVVDDQEALNHVIQNRKYSRMVNRFEILSDGSEIPYGGEADGPEDDRISVRFVPIEKYMNGHIWREEIRYHDEAIVLIDKKTKDVIQQIEPAIVHLNGLTERESYMKSFNWWQVRDDLSCPFQEKP